MDFRSLLGGLLYGCIYVVMHLTCMEHVLIENFIFSYLMTVMRDTSMSVIFGPFFSWWGVLWTL